MMEDIAIGQRGPTPGHIPPELTRTFDFRTDLGDRPHDLIAGLHDGPPIFYSPERHTFGIAQGMWVITRAAHIREVMAQPEIFSSTIQGEFLEAIGEDIRLPPLDTDPPAHGDFRSILSPLFTAKRIVALEPLIQARCAELIEPLSGRTGCEFIGDFASRFPTGIFIDLMGLPLQRLDDFIGWARNFVHGRTPEERLAAVRSIAGYFRALHRDPAAIGEGSIVRYVLDQRIAGRTLDERQFSSLCFLLFSAGMDTVMSALGFIFKLLAERQDIQTHLRDHPEAIPRHVEECMRLFAPVTPQRVAMCDVTLGGVTIRKGDCIALSLAAASRDPAEFDDAATLDARRNPNPHFAFGYGIHRCVGAQLARRDMAIAVEEWLTRFPPFRLSDVHRIQASGGSVLSLDALHLRWG